MGLSGPLGPPWPRGAVTDGAVTDIGSVCASRDLRLESKSHHRVIVGFKRVCYHVLSFPLIFHLQNVDFSVPIENGPLGPPRKKQSQKQKRKSEISQKVAKQVVK